MTSPGGATDDDLARLAATGDLAAFNLLVDRHQDAVYGLALRIIGSREAAEDATQEAFLSAFRSIRSYHGGSFRNWLFRIAANACNDEFRRRQRRPASSLEGMAEAAGRPVEVADPEPGAEVMVERLELSGALMGLLDRLPFDQRQAVLLVDVYDFPYEEVARIAGTRLGTAKSRVHRGRARLRELVGEQPELFGGAKR